MVTATPTTPSRRLDSLAGAAAYAKVDPRTIRRRIADGTLTGYRVGPRLVRVDLNEVDAMMVRIPAAGRDGVGDHAA